MTTTTSPNNVDPRTLNLEQSSPVEHRTLNIEHRTLNVEQFSPPLEKETCPPLEGVGGGHPELVEGLTLAERLGTVPYNPEPRTIFSR